MLTKIFYLIVVPSILAFFLGYIAHGLKTMTTTAGEKDQGSQGNQDDSAGKKLEPGSKSETEGQKEPAKVGVAE